MLDNFGASTNDRWKPCDQNIHSTCGSHIKPWVIGASDVEMGTIMDHTMGQNLDMMGKLSINYRKWQWITWSEFLFTSLGDFSVGIVFN